MLTIKKKIIILFFFILFKKNLFQTTFKSTIDIFLIQVIIF